MEKRASSCAEAEFALQTWVEDTESAVWYYMCAVNILNFTLLGAPYRQTFHGPGIIPGNTLWEKLDIHKFSTISYPNSSIINLLTV